MAFVPTMSTNVCCEIYPAFIAVMIPVKNVMKTNSEWFPFTNLSFYKDHKVTLNITMYCHCSSNPLH